MASVLSLLFEKKILQKLYFHWTQKRKKILPNSENGQCMPDKNMKFNYKHDLQSFEFNVLYAFASNFLLHSSERIIGMNEWYFFAYSSQSYFKRKNFDMNHISCVSEHRFIFRVNVLHSEWYKAAWKTSVWSIDMTKFLQKRRAKEKNAPNAHFICLQLVF